jgi:hypothetical protein
LSTSAASNAHPRARLAIVTQSDASREPDILELAVPLVAIELVRLGVVGHDDVGPAVLVVIQQRNTERLRAGVENSGRRGDVLEGTVAAIAEQPAGFTAVRLWCAVGLLLAVETAEHIPIGRPADVIADEQVQAPIAIDVDPHRRGAECGTATEAARPGDIDEASLSGVAKQPALPDTRDEQIREAVVVEVADGHAHAVQFDVEAGRSRDVGKGAVPVVPVERKRGPLALVPGPIAAVHEQDVLPPITVVVEKRATRSECLGQEFAAVRTVVVAERDAGGARDINKPEPWRRLSLGVGTPRKGSACQAGTGMTDEFAPVHSGLMSPCCKAYMTSSAVLCTPSAFMMRAR